MDGWLGTWRARRGTPAADGRFLRALTRSNSNGLFLQSALRAACPEIEVNSPEAQRPDTSSAFYASGPPPRARPAWFSHAMGDGRSGLQLLGSFYACYLCWDSLPIAEVSSNG